MKKIALLCVILSLMTVGVFAGERYAQQTSVYSQNGGIHFSLPSYRSGVRLFSDDDGISSEESIGHSQSSHRKRSGKEIAGLVVGGIGAGGFGLNWFTYLIVGLVAPFAACGSTAILAQRPLCIGIMATSWVPIIGSFAGGAMTLMMTDDKLYCSSYADYELYCGVGTYCIITGLLETAFLAMMISGFAYAGYQKRKSKTAMALMNSKVMPIVGSNTLGLKVRI